MLALGAPAGHDAAVRVECSHCQTLIEIAGLAAVAGGLGFICEKCGGVSVLAPVIQAPVQATAPPSVQAPPAQAPPAPSRQASVPEGHAACPKCGQLHPLDASESCARCGLVFAKVANGSARLPAAPTVMPALRGRWIQLAQELDNMAAHHAFIEACAAQDALEFAGFCYRSLTPPGQLEDPRVAGYRDRVLRQAVARVSMLATPRATEENDRTRKLVTALVAAFILLLFALGYWYMARYSQALQLRV